MIVIIPARYASTRLPAKALLDIDGQAMIVRVWQRAQQCGASRVAVATDDTRVADTVRAAGGEVLMTRADHASGTDRLAEAAAQLGCADDEIIVNLQGDEPLMPPTLVRRVAETLAAHPAASVATASHPIHDADSLRNPNVVKVVTDRHGYALYFSRAPIPWPRDAMQAAGDFAVRAQRHIGLYAYRAGFLRRYTQWPACALEELEALEQLRVLWQGEKIAVYETDAAPAAGVDTAADLERVRAVFRAARGA